MIKRRTLHFVTNNGVVTMTKLAAIVGGVEATKVVGVWKLGNKEWTDDWLAPK